MRRCSRRSLRAVHSKAGRSRVNVDEGMASGAGVAPAQGRTAISNEVSEVGPKAGAGRARSDGREGRLRWGPSAQRIQRTPAVVHGSNSGQACREPNEKLTFNFIWLRKIT